MDLRNQRRMSAELLKCGAHRVQFSTMHLEDISEAITRSDIRSMTHDRLIRKKQKIGVSKGRTRHMLEQKRKGKRKGQGSRKGASFARYPRKRRWIDTIRPIRKLLKYWRENGYIDRKVYRQYYLYAKGGLFKNKHHMFMQMTAKNVFQKQPDGTRIVREVN